MNIVKVYQRQIMCYRVLGAGRKKKSLRFLIEEMAYAEDVLEHLSQIDLMKFMAEVYRVLINGGVFRVSFPHIDSLLGYSCIDFLLGCPYTYEFFDWLKKDNYDRWGHIHFPDINEIECIGSYIGFKSVNKCKFGVSDHEVLCSLETRKEQRFSNAHLELVK